MDMCIRVVRGSAILEKNLKLISCNMLQIPGISILPSGLVGVGPLALRNFHVDMFSIIGRHHMTTHFTVFLNKEHFFGDNLMSYFKTLKHQPSSI